MKWSVLLVLLCARILLCEGCGSNITDQPQGRIMYSEYPRQDWDVDCMWTFKPPSKSAIILVILDRFHSSWSAPCNPYPYYNRHSLTFINGQDYIVNKVCGRRFWYSFASYGSAKVRYKSDFYARFYYEIKWEMRYYIFNQGIDKSLIDDTWNIIALSSNSSDIKVNWTKYQINNGDYTTNITKYFVLCTPQNDPSNITSWTANGNNTGIEVKNLTANNEYMIQVIVLVTFDHLPQEFSKNKTIRASQPVVVRTTKNGPTPLSPSLQDRRNSVNVSIGGLTVSEWDAFIDFRFRNVIAVVVTDYCSFNGQRCFPLVRRIGRSNSVHVTFTTQEVHLLPGYPAQLSYSSIPDHMIAVVSFYVKFPPGVAIGVTDTVDRDLLVDIVNGSLARIGRAINKTMYTAKDLFTTTVPTGQSSSYNKPAIIGGSVAAVILVVIAVVIGFAVYRRNYENKTYYIEHVGQPVSDIPRLKKPSDIENPVYEPAT